MDYEKKYKEALKRAKMYQGMIVLPAESMIETIFPELVESEDERIRKCLITIIKIQKEGSFGLECNHGASWNEMLAWLEKQGQKSADKVKSKFHEGDWVIGRVTDNEPRQIAEITEEGYKTTYDGWIGFSFEEDIHLWSIEDAKPGDVLVASDGSLFIFAKVKDNSAYYHISLCKNGSMEISDGNHAWETASGSRPATKEQRDMLFQKMHEAGYTFDFESKELKKIEQKPILDIEIPFGAKDSELQEATYLIPEGFHAEIEGNRVVIKQGEQKHIEEAIGNAVVGYKKLIEAAKTVVRERHDFKPMSIYLLEDALEELGENWEE